MSRAHLAVLVFTALALLLLCGGSTAHVSSQKPQKQARQGQAVPEAHTTLQHSGTARQQGTARQPLSRLLLEKGPTVLEESKENEGSGGKPPWITHSLHILPS